MAKVSIFLVTVAFIAVMIICVQPEPEYTPMVAAGWEHTVGLKADGTVVAVGAETEPPTWNLSEAAP